MCNFAGAKPVSPKVSLLPSLSSTMSVNAFKKVAASFVWMFICSAIQRARSALSMFVSAVLLFGCFGYKKTSARVEGRLVGQKERKHEKNEIAGAIASK